MKKTLAILALAWLSLASAQTVVKLQGFGGNDTAILSSLVREIVNPALEKEGIRAEYRASRVITGPPCSTHFRPVRLPTSFMWTSSGRSRCLLRVGSSL